MGEAADADRRDAPINLAGRRIRVGYVSSDLREHAIGYLMAELFEIHDKTKFEVFGYYCGKDPQGDLNARIRSSWLPKVRSILPHPNQSPLTGSKVSQTPPAPQLPLRGKDNTLLC